MSASAASLPLCNKFPKIISFEPSFLISIPTHFKPNPKPNLTLKIKTDNPFSFTPLSRSLQSRNAAEFEGEQVPQEIENPESEQEEEELEEKEDEEIESEPESAESGRLYVGNLPYAMTSSQLAGIFGEAGNVVSVEIVYDRVTDRSRGFAFVTMATVQDAKEAIRMFDGSQVGGRTVKVNFPEVPRGGEREVIRPKIRRSYQGFIDSPHKLYASNLSWVITSEALRDAFADQQGLISAKVIYERDSGRSRGFGFVTFESAEAAESALSAMNGVEVEGRPLRLNLAEERTSLSRSSGLGRNYQNNMDGGEILSSVST